MRKTLHVADLIEWVNEHNASSTCAPEVRQGWNTMLEDLLHQCGVYAGFTYLVAHQVPEGQEPGVIFSQESRQNQYPDETRRQWFRHRHLNK